jgi:hypothetical protein
MRQRDFERATELSGGQKAEDGWQVFERRGSMLE